MGPLGKSLEGQKNAIMRVLGLDIYIFEQAACNRRGLCLPWFLVRA